MSKSTEKIDLGGTPGLVLENTSRLLKRRQSLEKLPPASEFALVASNHQESSFENTPEVIRRGASEICQASALATGGHRMRVSFAEQGHNSLVTSQPQDIAMGTGNNSRSGTGGRRSPEQMMLVDEPVGIETPSLVRRSLSLLGHVAHTTTATEMCEGSCAICSFPPASLKRFEGFDIAKGALLPTFALFLPITLPTHKTTSQKVSPISINSMGSISRGSFSRGTFSQFFKKTGSDPSGTSTGSGSIGVGSLRSMFSRDSVMIKRNSFEKNHPTTPSPSTPESPGASTPAAPAVSGISAVREVPEPLVSVWESDTEDEEEQMSFRTKIRTRMEKFKRNRLSSLPSPPSSSGSEPEKRPEIQPEYEWKARELRVVSGTYIPPQVFGRNIPYEITGRLETSPTRTFSHFRDLPRDYSPPAGNEVLHIREDGYEYLTLEKLSGVTCITAGTLQCLCAELAHPLFAKNDISMLFENILFCGSMIVGNVKLLEMLFRQIKGCAAKPEQQVNIIHFIMHWMQEKPEDFSWNEEILEIRHQVFRYLLAMFRQTELAADLLELSVKHEEIESAYLDFVIKQKRNWISFDNILMVYGRMTDCDLIDVGFSTVDTDDLTHYMAAVDLLLFRDGSEMSTLDQYWQEQSYQDTPQGYHANQFFTDRTSPWWWPAERAKRLLQRTKMIKHWVSLEILQLKTREARIRMVQVFITVASNLLEMGDFHGAHCIMQGLDSPLVCLLEHTWEGIGIRYIRRCKELREFLHNRAVYDAHLRVQSQDPVIPYYGYFLEEITTLRNEKDHSGRLRSTSSTKLHKDASLKEFGTWDTPEGKAPRPVSGDGAPQLPTSLDLKKYRDILTTVKSHQERAKPAYWFAGEITRKSFVMRLHLLGMNSFAGLADFEESAATGRKGALNPMSRLVETRILEAWSLIPKTGVPAAFQEEDTWRTIVLQKLHIATEE